MQRLDRRCCAWALLLLLLLCVSSLPRALAQADSDCGKGCRVISTDGSDASAPPHFLNAMLDDSITDIVLRAPRYQLKPLAWAGYGQGNLFVLRRNLTIHSTVKPYGLMDFQLLERKVLLDTGVTVTFRSIVLQNIRKLGGFGLDFFVGNTGSQIVLQDIVRVKLACQLPQDVLNSARSFERVSPAFPPNNVTLLPRFCFTAALAYGPPLQHCFPDALHFSSFSMLSASNDPDSGGQYPGYVLFQQNTTRVCEYTITQECLAAHNGDEELCLAELVTQAMPGSDGGFVWTPGAIAGVAIAGGVLLAALALAAHYRNHLLLWCVRLDGKSLQDLESGSSHQVPEDGVNGNELNLEANSQGYVGRRAISQQVTLGVLLGAGSFGRVYRGRWHSSDVAIKIMSCTRAELAKVLREAEVMMQLNHPNIVRAFHASVWNPAEQVRALQAREAHSSSSSSGPASSQKAPAKRSSRRLSPAIDGKLQPKQRTASTSSPLACGPLRISSSCDGNTIQDVNNSTSANGLFAAAGAAATTGSAAAAAAEAAAAMGGGQDGGIAITVVPVAEWPAAVQACATVPAAAGAGAGQHPVDDTAHQWALQADAAATVAGSAAANAGAAGLPGQQQAAAVSAHMLELGGVPGASPSSSSVCNVGSFSTSKLARDSTAAAAAGGDASNAAAAAAALGGAPIGPGSSSTRIAEQQQQQQELVVQHVSGSHQLSGNCAVSSSSQPSAVGEAREESSPAGTADTAATTAAPAAGGGASFRQHLLGQLKRSSSSSSSSPLRVPISDTAPAAAAPAPSAAVAAAPAAPSALRPGMAVISCPEAQQQQQQQDHDSSGRSSDRHRCQQQQQEQASWEVAAATLQHEGQEEGQRSEVQVWLVLELCTGGTLKDAVTTGRLRVDVNIGVVKLLSRLLETANGMSYLHSKGVLHGDLKAGNVLLQNVHGSFDQVAKISDFGLVAVLLDGATHRSTASMGTITHMAPEVLRSGHISPAADVYSFGIMMWEVFTNRQAYQGLHYGAVVERVVIQKQRPPIPDDMPDEYSLLMCACWDVEPNKRPSFSQIVTCLELMIDNLTNDAEAEGDTSGGTSEGAGEGPSTGAAATAAAAAAGGWRGEQQAAGKAGAAARAADGAAGSAGPAGLAPSSGSCAAGSGGAAASGGGGSTGSAASGWRQQQQRVEYPVPPLPPVAVQGRLSAGSHSGQHSGVLTPTQLQQQRLQSEEFMAGTVGCSAGRLGMTSRTTHSMSSQQCASGASVLDSNQYLQDL